MVLVSGQPVSVVGGSLTVDTTIGKRGQARFTLHSDNMTHFQQYQQVAIYDQQQQLAFSGYITSPREQKPGFQPSLLHTITCVDQHFLADKRVYTASYTNATCGVIVQDIYTNVLAQEGVTIGYIYDGPLPSPTLYPSPLLLPTGNVGLIPSATFVYAKVSDILDAVVQEASTAGVPYFWMIDQFKRLYFGPYGTLVNANVVDGSQIEYVKTPTYVQRQNPTYRNTQYILGGTQQTGTITETRVGDSNTASWTMGYAFASMPTVKVNGVTQTVGVKGVNSSGYNFYWAKGDAVLTQDTGAAKLTSAQTLTVIYIGQYPGVTASSNAAQIAFQASLDGTSGIIEDVQTDATITSLSTGLIEASALLTRYATQGVQIQFLTSQYGFAPGQLVIVNLPDHGLLNTQMLIETVSATDQYDGYTLYWLVTAIVGPYDTSWVDFFRVLFSPTPVANAINVGTGSSVAILANFTAAITPTATLTVMVTPCPLPGPAQFPRPTLFVC